MRVLFHVAALAEFRAVGARGFIASSRTRWCSVCSKARTPLSWSPWSTSVANRATGRSVCGVDADANLDPDAVIADGVASIARDGPRAGAAPLRPPRRGGRLAPRSLIEAVRPSLLSARVEADVRRELDLATLEVCPGSFVDEELRHAHADLLYTTRTAEGREALVYVLFEHQSSFDARMPFRLLRYMVRIWERWLVEHPSSSTIPVVLPVVLHHGQAGWQAAPDLASMLDASPQLLEAARPYQPLFRFVLDDLADVAAESLASRALHAFGRLVELGFWSWRSYARLRDAAPLMRRIVATVARDERARVLLTQLYLYVMCGGESGIDAKEDVVNAAEQLIEQGRAEGRAEGLRDAVRNVMAKRHMPMSEAACMRLAACSDVATLTQWLANALTAGSEADVFSGEEGP